MTYTPRYQSGGRILLILFGGSGILIPLAFVLLYPTGNDLLIACSPVVVFFAVFFLSIRLSWITVKVDIGTDHLTVNKRRIPFTDIQSYFLRNPTPRTTVLDLTLQSGAEVSITGLNYDAYGPQIDGAVGYLLRQLKENGLTVLQVQSTASLRIKKYRRRWKILVKLVLALLVLTDVFMLVMVLMGHTRGISLVALIAMNASVLPLIRFLGTED